MILASFAVHAHTYTPDTSRTIGNTLRIHTVHIVGRKRERNTNLFNKYHTYT